MPSPFPGMNPFLEQSDTWEDFHLNFMSRAQAILTERVGEHYFVKVEVRLYVHELSEDERSYFGKADVGLTEITTTATASAGVATIAAPLTLSLPTTEIQKQPFLEIRDRRSRRVVTVIEILSPANKDASSNQAAYLAKRNALLAGNTHFVEIDLRRGGQRPQPPVLPECDYYVLVSRYEQRPKVGVWPIGLRERLPEIPIPLTAPDPDARLDLQQVLHQVYDGAGYGKYIYSETPEPPLGPDDEKWARGLLSSANGT